MKKYIVFILALISSQSHSQINITSFAEDGIQHWQKKSFSGETTYSVMSLDGETVLKASSEDTASSLYRQKRIDLQKTPYINWSWLISEKLPSMDERVKSGDDHAARIYVVIGNGIPGWTSKSLNYVWSSSQDAGQVWDNPFAGASVKLLSVRGRKDNTRQWYQEKRNTYQDLIQYFGDKGSEEANLTAYRYISLIAIMTDTDNSNTKAEAYYGDIIFTEN